MVQLFGSCSLLPCPQLPHPYLAGPGLEHTPWCCPGVLRIWIGRYGIFSSPLGKIAYQAGFRRMPLAIAVFLACWFVSMYLYTKVSFLVSMCLCFSNWNSCTSVLGCASRYISTMGISKVANGTGTFRRWVYQKWPMEQVRFGGNPIPYTTPFGSAESSK